MHISRTKRILLSWSGGKDSAWALHILQQASEFEVGGLLTTVNEKFARVAIHGFREELLERQSAATGLPLWRVPLPFPCSNEERSEEHTSELQSQSNLVCRLLLEKKK